MTPEADRRAGFWIGLGVVLVFSLGMVAYAFAVSDARYERNFPLNDGSYNLLNVFVVLSPGPAVPIPDLVGGFPPYDISTHWCSIYGPLPVLTARVLRAVLPVRPAVGVLLNGVWYVVLGISAYIFWIGRTGRWPESAALAVVLLTPGFLLDPDLMDDLASLDPNVVAYLLGVATVCWSLRSDGFVRPGSAAMAGLLAGVLALGRVYTLGLVAAMAAPSLVLAVRRAARGELRRVAACLALALACFLAVAAWHVFPRRAMILAYPTQFAAHGTVGVGVSRAVLAWTDSLGRIPRVNGAVLLVLAAFFAVRIRRASLATVLREVQWSNVWTAVSPALVLLLLHASGGVYLWPAFFGVLLLLAEPLRLSERTAPPPSGALARAALLGAALLGVASFALGEREINRRDLAPLSDARRVVETIRDHALARKRTRVTVGIIHWGTLHDATLAGLFVYGAGCRLDSPVTPRLDPARDPPLLSVLVPPCTPWQWKPHIAGAAVLTGARYAKMAEESLDYVVVLVNPAPQLPLQDRAAALLCQSPRFEVISPPLDIWWDGPVMVLARRENAAEKKEAGH